jgi:hypothetical protein
MSDQVQQQPGLTATHRRAAGSDRSAAEAMDGASAAAHDSSLPILNSSQSASLHSVVANFASAIMLNAFLPTIYVRLPAPLDIVTFNELPLDALVCK